MKIIIVGGHGKVALLAESLLVRTGHAVTAVIRDPEQADDVTATGAVPEIADVERLGTDELAKILSGQDAVVWSAGAGGGAPERTYAVDRDAAVRTIDAADQAGVHRFVMVSYLGAGKNHEVSAADGFYAYAQAKAAADSHLRASGLDWTILGPGALTLGPGSGRIVIVPHRADGGIPDEVPGGSSGTRASIPRADVAAVIAATLDAPAATAHRTIDFVGGASGSVPIAKALRP